MKPKHRHTLSKQMIYIGTLALAVSVCALLPILIKYKGALYLGGDYMTQLIPFIKESRRLVRAGGASWSMNSFLGANFVGTYAYYTLGSIFFWPLVLLPEAFLAQGISVMFVLKHVCAAVFSFLYLRQYFQKVHVVYAGALLYTFSSFSFDASYYYLFLDIIALFPLLLCLCDKCLQKRYAPLFSIAVMLNAASNFYLFVGTSVFFVIYLLFRWKIAGEYTLRDVLRCVLFYAVGALCAAVILLPGALTILDTAKTTGSFSELLARALGQIPLALKVLKAIILPSEGVNGAANGFRFGQYNSTAGFLPLLGAWFLVASLYLKSDKWYRKLLKLLVLLSFVPLGNGLFSLFTNVNYTRWWYAFILVAVLCSLKLLEQWQENPLPYRPALQKSARLIAVGGACVVLLPLVLKLLLNMQGAQSFIMEKLPRSAWETVKASGFFERLGGEDLRYALVLVLLSALSYGTLFVLCKKKYIFRAKPFIVALSLVCALSYMCYLTNDYDIFGGSQSASVSAVSMEAPDETVLYAYRTRYAHRYQNIGMLLNTPSENTFNSYKSKATAAFCRLAGIKTDSFAKKYYDTPAMDAVLSIRYRVDKHGQKTQNSLYVPMGYVYEYYVAAEGLESSESKQENNSRIETMCSACFLDAQTAVELSDVLAPLPQERIDAKRAIKAARQSACTDLEITQNALHATTQGARKRLVYFSLPHDGGWKAYVNAEQTKIYTVNGGMMGIVVPAGKSEIRLVYETPGLKAGACISAATLAGLAVYAAAAARKRKKDSE